MKNKVYDKLAVAIVMLGACLSGCGHVAHRAGVEPGFNASVMLAPTYETYHDPPQDYWEQKKSPGWAETDVQGNLGYAWDIGQGRRLLVQGVILIFRDADIPIPHSIDVYYQAKAGKANAGVGVMLGMDPRLYLLWGRDYGPPEKRFRSGLDFGLGFAPAGISVIPQVTYSLSHGAFRPSLLLEYRYFLSNKEIFCFDNCSDADNPRSRLSIGLFVSFGKTPE